MALEIKYPPKDAELPITTSSEDREFHRAVLNGKFFYIDETTGAMLDTTPAFLKFEPTGREPLKITIGDRVYKLHRKRLYIPERMTLEETETLYDFLARSGYEEQLLDSVFNISVYHYLFDLTLKAKEFKAKPILLDYGCGTGIAVLASATYHRRLGLVGVDISEEMTRISRRNGLDAVKTHNELPFKSDSFDAVVMGYVADFLASFQPYQQIHRVLKEQSRIAFNLYRPSGHFQEHYSNVLRALGFVNIELSQKQISTSTTTRDLWFVVAEKPITPSQ